MAIKYACNYRGEPTFNKFIVLKTGTVQPGNLIVWDGPAPELICDTAEEAERMRLLIERRREEVEAVERKYELLIAAEVSA